MKKLLPATKYQYSTYLKPITISYLIYVLLNVSSIYLYMEQLRMGQISRFELEVNNIVDSFGFDYITFLIMALISYWGYSASVRNLSQNGFTRRQIYFSKVLSIILLGFTVGILNLVVSVTKDIVLGLEVTPILMNIVTHLVFSLLYTLVGVFFTLLAIIVEKIGGIKTFIILVVFSLFIQTFIVFIQEIVSQDFMSKINYLINYTGLNGQYIVVPSLIVSMLIMGVSLVISDRTEIKEN